ncbi:MAG: ABC transporter ATP-binding protein [Microbacteriaceae bacterium]
MAQQPDSTYLSIQNLQKTYPKTTAPAVDDVNLDVKRGDLVALLGPSGCGKTTTLRMVAGLLEPSSGKILVNGKDVVSIPVHKRGMGMVFQSYALFPHLTIAENVAFGLQMKKIPRAKIDGLVTEALEMVQLSHLKGRKPAELSGGQQQRVSLARALAIEPTLLLLDEPLSNLDAKLREAMRQEIRAIQQNSGTTTLFVTHDQDEALDMADKIAILNDGVIEQYDSPAEVYEHPATKFVANFVGKANFIPVKSVEPGHGTAYRVGSDLFGELEVKGPAALAGKKASIVVRPHRVFIYAEGTAVREGLPRVAGTVVGSSYTGNVKSYEVLLAGGQTMKVDQLSNPGRPLAVGEETIVSFDPSDAYLVCDEQ